MKIYTNVDEFLKENNLDMFNEHEKCFRRVVEELDFNTCKQILLRQLDRDGITIERLKEKYNQDKYLNNIYSMGATTWEWDYIGNDVIEMDYFDTEKDKEALEEYIKLLECMGAEYREIA